MVLNFWRSSGVMVSAFAMTGIKLTRVPSFFMISTSSGFNLPYFMRPERNRCLMINYSRSTSWFDEIQTRMDPQVLLFFSKGLLLLAHVGFVLVVNKVNNRAP